MPRVWRDWRAALTRPALALALGLLWLCCFAGTFRFAYTNPDTNIDGSVLTDLDHTEWWLHRCMADSIVRRLPPLKSTFIMRSDSIRLADRPATGREAMDDSFDVGDLIGRQYWLKGRAWDHSGNKIAWQDAPSHTFAIEATAAPPPPPPDTSGVGGITGRYYRGMYREIRVGIREKEQINFAWGTASPWPGVVPADSFSVEWDGQIIIPTTGDYTFCLESEDGAQLYLLNWTWSINHYDPQPVTEWCKPVTLQAGAQPIHVNYFNRLGNAQVRLYITGPGIPKQVVPRSWLR